MTLLVLLQKAEHVRQTLFVPFLARHLGLFVGHFVELCDCVGGVAELQCKRRVHGRCREPLSERFEVVHRVLDRRVVMRDVCVYKKWLSKLCMARLRLGEIRLVGEARVSWEVVETVVGMGTQECTLQDEVIPRGNVEEGDVVELLKRGLAGSTMEVLASETQLSKSK